MGSVERNRLFSTASYVGILVHSYGASAVAARLLNRVLPSASFEHWSNERYQNATLS